MKTSQVMDRILPRFIIFSFSSIVGMVIRGMYLKHTSKYMNHLEPQLMQPVPPQLHHCLQNLKYLRMLQKRIWMLIRCPLYLAAKWKIIKDIFIYDIKKFIFVHRIYLKHVFSWENSIFYGSLVKNYPTPCLVQEFVQFLRNINFLLYEFS